MHRFGGPIAMVPKKTDVLFTRELMKNQCNSAGSGESGNFEFQTQE